jgi:hypothetical protein
MATLTPENYEKLVRLTSTESGRQSPEGQVLANDPELMAEITRRMQEFTSADAAPGLAANVQKVVAAPGVATTNIISGATETLFGTAILGADLLRAITPDGSDINNSLTEGRQNLVNMRKQAEIDTAKSIEEQLGGNALEGVNQLAAEGIPKLAGELLPILYLPSGLSTYWRTVGYNGLVGVGIGGIADKEAEDLTDRLGTMTATGAATLAISGALHAPSGFRAYGARKIRDQLETKLAKQNLALEKEVQRVTGNPEFSFDLGQVTANPFIVGLQQGAAKEATRAHQNAQIQTLIDATKFRANALSTGGNADQIAIDLNKVIVTINKEMNKKFVSNFGSGLDNIVAKHGDEIVFDGAGYVAGAKKALERFTDPTLGGSSAPKFLTEQIRVLEAEMASSGGLNVKTVTKLLQSFRNISSGNASTTLEGVSPMAAKNLANELESAMLNSLDDAATTNPEAIAAIQNLRTIYAFEKAGQKSINNQLLAGVFGVEDASAINATTGFARIEGLSERAQQSMVRVLDDIDPALMNDIRAEKIRQVVKRSFVPNAPQSVTPYSPDLLARQLSGGAGVEGGSMRGLFSAKEALNFKRTGQALRTINETYLSAFPEASGTMVKEASINVISRAPEFFARWMTGLMAQGSTVERMLMDPAFRQSVIQVAEGGLGNKASQAAMTYMLITANEWAMTAKNEERAEARLARDETLQEGPRGEGT